MESLFSMDHVYRTRCRVTVHIHSMLAKFDTLSSFMYSCNTSFKQKKKKEKKGFTYEATGRI